MTGAAPAVTGLYGKLPRHGDYVRRALPEGFAPRWGDWLAACMDRAVAALGREGLEAAWPGLGAWRFQAAAGLFGPWAPTGILVPSRDAVGRLFPLTLVAACSPLPEAAWFAALEALAVEAVAGGLDADGLAAAAPPAVAEGEGMPAGPGTIAWWRAGLEPAAMPLGPDQLLRLLGREGGAP